MILQYLCMILLDLRTKLRRIKERGLPHQKLKVVFRSKCRLDKLFWFKGSLEKKIHSGIIYI